MQPTLSFPQLDSTQRAPKQHFFFAIALFPLIKQTERNSPDITHTFFLSFWGTEVSVGRGRLGLSLLDKCFFALPCGSKLAGCLLPTVYSISVGGRRRETFPITDRRRFPETKKKFDIEKLIPAPPSIKRG